MKVAVMIVLVGALCAAVQGSPVGQCPPKNGERPVYLEDSESCTIFYECNEGVATALECSEGLHFNPVLDVCDFPEEAGCEAGRRREPAPRSAVGSCPAVDGANPTYLPDSNNCSLFYECRGGQAYQLVCPGDLHFNPEINVCDFADRAGCEAGSSIAPQAAVGTCPSVDGANPTYLPDSKNCSLFYECSNGRANQLRCPAGLHFSTRTNTCDFPDRAGCEAGSSIAPQSAVGRCPAVDGAYPTYLPDSKDCSLFYECSNGWAYQFACPAGLHFNPRSHVCDYPYRAGCKAGSSIAPQSAVGSCPAVDGAYPTYLPDSKDCSLFYECSNGWAYQFACPAGLHFNPRSHVCDYPYRAGCKAGSSIAPQSAVGSCPAVDGASPTYLPDSKDCSVFYECSNGWAYQFECPAGLHFNPRTHVCDSPDWAGCQVDS